MKIKVAILTISDKGAAGEREDRSGPAIKEMIEKAGGEVAASKIIPDEQTEIKRALTEWSETGVDVIFTTGGTGFSPRDWTPEATRAVIEREAPGLTEAMRFIATQKTPRAMLSRAVAGIRKSTLIINLPGSVRGVRENLEVILPVLEHAVKILKGQVSQCGEDSHG